MLGGVDQYLQQASDVMGTATGWGSQLILVTIQSLRYQLLSTVTEHPRIQAFRCILEIYERGNRQPTDDNPAIGSETLFEAARFLEKLPVEIPAPDVDVTPDREIMFTWLKDEDHSYIASFVGNGVVYYAGLFGDPNRKRGREAFVQKIPDSVLLDLRRLHGLGE